MTELRKLWKDTFPPIPEDEMELITAAAGDKALSEAACCFRLFRILHSLARPGAVLMGDYCFGRFSAHLAAIDSVELTDAFADFLKRDTLESLDFGEYLKFVKRASLLV